jgi:hypothetical protein
MKLSKKIMKLVTTSMSTKGSIGYERDWQWMRENTEFVEWYEDALSLERYIDAFKDGKETIKHEGITWNS